MFVKPHRLLSFLLLLRKKFVTTRCHFVILIYDFTLKEISPRGVVGDVLEVARLVVLQEVYQSALPRAHRADNHQGFLHVPCGPSSLACFVFF